MHFTVACCYDDNDPKENINQGPELNRLSFTIEKGSRASHLKSS